MGNFEKLSVVVIVVIIVMILVVALYTWTDSPQSGGTAVADRNTPITVTEPSTPVAGPGVMPLPPIVGPAGKTQPPAPAKGGVDPLTGAPLNVVVPVYDPLHPELGGTQPVPEEAKAEAKTHKVVAGDTLGKISAQYYGSSKHVTELQKANPDVNALALRPGMTISIPPLADAKAAKGTDLKDTVKDAPKAAKEVATVQPGGIYTVRKGDKLPDIARRTYGSIDRWPDVWLENYDKIEDPDVLIPGTRLKLPK